jgi:hypothetical protein
MTRMKLLMHSGKCQRGAPQQRASLPQHAPDREHNKLAAGCAPQPAHTPMSLLTQGWPNTGVASPRARQQPLLSPKACNLSCTWAPKLATATEVAAMTTTAT